EKTPPTADFSKADLEFFEKDVRPLLANHCQKCHGAKTQKGGLRLDSRDAALAGGDTGPAVVPGKPDESLLIDAVNYGELYQMPPTGKLADADVANLRGWVERGAPWPAEAAPVASGERQPMAAFDLDERARHWCFQPLGEHRVPQVADAGWASSPIDRFILARLEAAGLPPAAGTDKRTLLRRLTFDLIGLPPTPAEIKAFLADDSPDALSRVVDRLLASPHFGERWGRHWLDLVRYAESRGHEFDHEMPNAWQYRDYVIRAFNADVPYGRFVTEHVAGDLLEPPRRNAAGANESILGTGFWFLGEEVHSPIDVEADELDRTDNKLDVFSKAFLALTVACARCHDHKFDAISTSDYYALSGFLLSSGYRQAAFDALDRQRQVAGELAELRQAQGPAVLGHVLTAMRPTLERTAALLLAARDVLGAAPIEASAAADAARQQAIEAVAAGKQLPPGLLSAWVERVRAAANDAASPLHPWAVLAANRAVAGPQVAEQLRPLAERLRNERASASAEYKTIVDYCNLSPSDWLQDGSLFRLAAVGEPQFAASAERPITRIFDRAAAASDPLCDVATLAPGVGRDAGRLSWLQSGRTLRTPSFTLSGRKLYYLVSGSGYAYAAVHSHRLNNGPLHGAMIREWQAGDRFQWIEQDLSAYAGRRVHIEFTPHLPSELQPGMSPSLAIAQVVEADQMPALPDASLLPERLFAEANLVSLESLAAAYQQMFLAAANGDSFHSSPGTSKSDARLADWLVQNVDLFAPPNEPARQAMAEAVAPFMAAQARLIDRLPRQVHTAPALLDGSGVDQHVMLRGNHKTPGDPAERRHLTALAGKDQAAITSGSGRLELARRMTDPRQPLVARVIVNRVWQHLFGRGLVPTSDNFGVMGELPTHPELLDFLTDDFTRDGWSIKRLIRRLVLTSTYQMSSQPSERAKEIDPRNLLWSYRPVRRLEAEAIRDAVLAVSGRLDARLFGASVPTYLSELVEGRGRPASGPLDGDGRRSVYLSVRRNFLNPFFQAFDYPVPSTTVGRRGVSNVPAQALALMNSPFVVAEARRWADRLQPSESTTLRIERLYLSALARPPSDEERRAAAAFLAAQSQRYGAAANDPRAWADLCHVMFNSKEFIFVE
ncbi:MAG TPA: PSD1 and planctomycete cytochrome C domain-containing protein, partial [Pirellulales bacterium]|nr:PSD1 and planctomycete cytochrome C domain-containing protein [Pirellulales bacterium]